MKAVSRLKLRTLGRDYILVTQSGGLVNSNKMISFNASAAYLWEAVSQRESFNSDDLASLLVEKYDIDMETASADAGKLCAKWLEAGIVTD